MQVMPYFLTGLLSFMVFFENVKALSAEPVCSKFNYEMKTLEAMLRMENRVEKMMEEITSVKDRVTKELDEFKSRQDEAERQLKAMESKITALKSEVEVKTRPDEVIAFSVRRPTKKLVNGVPTFSEVITNIGNGYDVDTGIFTCHVSGLYMFVFTVGSQGQHDVYCWISRNGSNTVFGRSYIDNSYTTASASVNLLLQTGDLVTLGDCRGWSNVYSSDFATTFNGALLQKTERENQPCIFPYRKFCSYFCVLW